MGGGQGGSEAGDGVSALLWPTSAANTSIELFEQRVPVLVTEKSLCGRLRRTRPPSRRARPARQRAQARRRRPADARLGLPGRRRHRGAGPVRRQARAARRAAWCAMPPGAIIQDCGTGQLVSTTTDQEIVEVCLSGGSGFGSPFERPLAAIARDLAEGYVTPEAAARDYGVVIGADGKLDLAQSARTARAGHGGGVTRLNAKRTRFLPSPGRSLRRRCCSFCSSSCRSA